MFFNARYLLSRSVKKREKVAVLNHMYAGTVIKTKRNLLYNISSCRSNSNFFARTFPFQPIKQKQNNGFSFQAKSFPLNRKGHTRTFCSRPNKQYKPKLVHQYTTQFSTGRESSNLSKSTTLGNGNPWFQGGTRRSWRHKHNLSPANAKQSGSYSRTFSHVGTVSSGVAQTSFDHKNTLAGPLSKTKRTLLYNFFISVSVSNCFTEHLHSTCTPGQYPAQHPAEHPVEHEAEKFATNNPPTREARTHLWGTGEQSIFQSIHYRFKRIPFNHLESIPRTR